MNTAAGPWLFFLWRRVIGLPREEDWPKESPVRYSMAWGPTGTAQPSAQLLPSLSMQENHLLLVSPTQNNLHGVFHCPYLHSACKATALYSIRQGKVTVWVGRWEYACILVYKYTTNLQNHHHWHSVKKSHVFSCEVLYASMLSSSGTASLAVQLYEKRY